MHSKIIFLFALIAGSAFADRTIYFSQTTNYCMGGTNPQFHCLQGKIMIYNPSTVSQTLTINQSLQYQSAAGVSKTDVTSASMTLAPGAANHALIDKTVLPYGCAGVGLYFGSVTVTGDQGFVFASGGLYTATESSVTAMSSPLTSFEITCSDQPFQINGGHAF